MRLSQELRHGLAVLAVGLVLALTGCNGNPGNTPATDSTTLPAATESTGVGGNTAPVTSTEALTDTGTMTDTTSP